MVDTMFVREESYFHVQLKMKIANLLYTAFNYQLNCYTITLFLDFLMAFKLSWVMLSDQ